MERRARSGPRLRIGIDARMGEGDSGGVQQVVIGLAAGLAEIDEGTEEFHFLVGREAPAWLVPYLRGPCRALPSLSSDRTGQPGWKRAIKAVVPAGVLDAAYRRIVDALPARVPTSDGTVERAGIDVLHQTIQEGFETAVPTVYMPYDLQHLHFPGFFTPAALRRKAACYPALAARAGVVVAISRWGKEDLVRNLGVSAGKVRVVHLAPAVDAYPEPAPGALDRLRREHALPESFVYYPAHTWKHKNHLRLLEALALLRRRDGLVVPAVFTGHQGDHQPAIARTAADLGIADQVRFLGFVSGAEVRALYGSARALVFPSLFEGFGMPVVEAFRLGTPVACSNATSLPEVAGDAALLLDPLSVEGIAEPIRRLWTDPALRDSLSRKGRARSAAFSWRETALRFRAIYRLLGGRDLCEEDRRRLAESL